MKKILISVMTLVLVIGMVGAGAFAYFSDTETSYDNTFTAGTIDLSEPESQIIKMKDLKPCETGLLAFAVHNIGTNSMDVWKHIFNVRCTEGLSPEPELEYYLANGIDPGTGKNDIDTVIVYDMYVGIIDDIEAFFAYMEACTGECMGENGSLEECLMECAGEYIEWSPVVEPDKGLTIADVISFYIYLGELEPGDCMVVLQSYHMDGEDTENWAQGDEMMFDVEFYAEQLEGPGPPGPIWP